MLFKPDFAPSAFMTRHYEFGGEADQFDHMIFTLARIALAGAEFSAGHTLRIFIAKTFKFQISFFSSSFVPIAAVFLRYEQIFAQALYRTSVTHLRMRNSE